MQCGALSCLGPLFAASTCLQPPAAAMSKVDIQGEIKIPPRALSLMHPMAESSRKVLRCPLHGGVNSGLWAWEPGWCRHHCHAESRSSCCLKSSRHGNTQESVDELIRPLPLQAARIQQLRGCWACWRFWRLLLQLPCPRKPWLRCSRWLWHSRRRCEAAGTCCERPLGRACRPGPRLESRLMQQVSCRCDLLCCWRLIEPQGRTSSGLLRPAHPKMLHCKDFGHVHSSQRCITVPTGDVLVKGREFHAGAERAAVQGLRLLGCYLKACAERAGSARPEAFLETSSPALDQIRLSKRQALRDAAASDALQDWSFTCGRVLPQVSFSQAFFLCLTPSTVFPPHHTPSTGPASISDVRTGHLALQNAECCYVTSA